jgi:hypothetical protein
MLSTEATHAVGGTTVQALRLGVLQGSRTLTVVSVVLLVLALPTAALGLFDDRTVGNLPWAANVWAKPLKFQLSMAVQLLTIAWALAWMRRHGHAVPARKAMVIALVVTVLFETTYITVQGARGVASHFNRATQLESIGANLMAGGAYVLVASSAWVGAAAFRHGLRQAPGQRQPMLVAIALGFVLMFFLAGFTGSAMGQYRGPFVQAISGPGSPWLLTGWRMDIGDLRIAHFMGVHAMQAVPLMAWVALKARWRHAQGAVVLFAGVWAGVTVLLMQLALANRGLG